MPKPGIDFYFLTLCGLLVTAGVIMVAIAKRIKEWM